jgi:ABC-type Fe3+-hydroxamate transport system substrate-binding protein
VKIKKSMVLVLTMACLVLSGCTRYIKKQQARAIQAGAQLDLNLIYDAEKEFHAKNGFYTTDLVALRIWPKKILYKIGFVQPAAKNVGMTEGLDNSRLNLDIVKKAHPDWVIEYSSLTHLNEIDFAKMASFCPDCTAGKTYFKAVAVANLNDDPILDVWTIDEKHKVQHLIDDLGH